MSETPSEQHEPPVPAGPRLFIERVPVIDDRPFLVRHGIAVLALAFAIAGCVLGAVALSRSGHEHRWYGCPPVILDASQGRPFYADAQWRCPELLVQPGSSSEGIVPQIRPNINPGGPMIPVPTQQP